MKPVPSAAGTLRWRACGRGGGREGTGFAPSTKTMGDWCSVHLAAACVGGVVGPPLGGSRPSAHVLSLIRRCRCKLRGLRRTPDGYRLSIAHDPQRPSFCCKNPLDVHTRRCDAGQALPRPRAAGRGGCRLQRGVAAGMGRRAGARKRRKKPRRARTWCAPAPAAPAPAAPFQARRGQADRTPRWGRPHRWTAPLGCSTRSSESLHPT